MQVAWFRCFIRGENFPGQLVGKAEPVGFYVTRFVEAADVKAAEATAVQALRAEPKLAPPPPYTPSTRVRIYFEKIEELPASDVPAVNPGFAWYPMDGADAEPGAAGGSGT
jgi:hypothetical protein